VLRLGSRMQTRTLLANAGAQAHGIVRGEMGMRCVMISHCCIVASFDSAWPLESSSEQTTPGWDVRGAANSYPASTRVHVGTSSSAWRCLL
jgi:hypothetical protein